MSVVKKISIHAWLGWGIATFFYAYQYVLRVFPSIMMDEIREKFHVNAEQFGDFSGAYYLGYALIHIPVGLLLDRVGPRWVITISVMCCTLSLVPLMADCPWWFAVSGRFMLGVGSSAAILGVFKVIRLNFPSQKFATVLGFSVMIGLLGAMYGGLPVQNLVAAYGWEMVLVGLLGAGLLLSGLSAALIPRADPKQGSPSTSSTEPGSFKAVLKASIKTPYVLSTAVLAALMVGPLEGFADVWGVSFFIKVYGLSKGTAAFLPSLIFLGMCFSAPLMAYIAEKTGRYKLIVQLSALLMGIWFVLILRCALPLAGVRVALIAIGALSAYQVLVIHINSMRVAAQHSGIVSSLTNMIIMSFGYIFHYVIGVLLDKGWQGEVQNGLYLYPREAYIMAISVIPLALFLAFLGFMGENLHAKFKSASSKRVQ
jgi:MFS family permease